MKQDKIRFAFAVTNNNNFEATHFGDADKYLIYEFDGEHFHLVKEQANPFTSIDEELEHGSRKKGNSIIGLLKDSGVNILISQQFGRNIKMVNHHFIPVIIRNQTLTNVFSILSAKMQWLVDELELNTEEHKLFSINKGIMKCAVKRGVEPVC